MRRWIAAALAGALSALLYSPLTTTPAFAQDHAPLVTSAPHVAAPPPTATPNPQTNVAASTIARQNRRPGDPIINFPGAVRGVAYQSLTNGKPVTSTHLFGRSGHPDGYEAMQGHAGDCYLIATMAVYAQFHPQVIKSVFLQNDGSLRRSPGGAAAARYFERHQDTGRFGAADPAIYDGRAAVRTESGKLPFAKQVDHKIWAPMLEYTFTKFRNQQGGAVHSTKQSEDRTGMNRTANGGYPNHVMRALTGHDADTIEVHPHNEDEVWEKLTAAQNSNKVVVVGSTLKTELRSRVRDELKDGHLRKEDSADMKFDGDRWVPTHAYSAWGDKDHPFLFEKNGVRMIRLRNPWGESAPGGVGNNGVGEITFRDFMMRYDRAWVGASVAVGHARAPETPAPSTPQAKEGAP